MITVPYETLEDLYAVGWCPECDTPVEDCLNGYRVNLGLRPIITAQPKEIYL